MKTKTWFGIEEVYVIVDNYIEGSSVDDIVYTDLKEAETVCAQYNDGKTSQHVCDVISISDYADAQYSRGNDAAYYD
jgi:hypothetical protein